ncbi:MAG: YHS domain-containing (seleno)protein [Pseudomonadota bacterium]
MTRFLTLCLLAISATGVQAGDQYIDRSGYAAGGYDVVAFHGLPPGAPATPGSATFTAQHNGAVWAFSSAASRDRFAADPSRYAPQYDGHCAYGVAQGYKVPGNPNLWQLVDGRLYLNIVPRVARTWSRDTAGYIARSEGAWPSLDATAASTGSWRARRANRDTFSDNTPSR